MVLLTDVYRNLTSLRIEPRERAFKQFKSPVLNVLTFSECGLSVKVIFLYNVECNFKRLTYLRHPL